MQLIGLALLTFVIWYGFADRVDETTISAFDTHAFVVVMGGSLSAILSSSSATTAFRTFALLRDILPGIGALGPGTEGLEAERQQLRELWLDGKRAQAVQLAEQSKFAAISRMLTLTLDRAPKEAISAAFLELQHTEMSYWQPGIANWEVLAKLAPSFGMVGTITGMIQLFKTLGEDTNMGAAISLALLATLYGVAFGAGVAGPIGHYLRNLLDERIGALERCEHTVAELIARSRAGLAGG